MKSQPRTQEFWIVGDILLDKIFLFLNNTVFRQIVHTNMRYRMTDNFPSNENNNFKSSNDFYT